jgi:hypothetical protein
MLPDKFNHNLDGGSNPDQADQPKNFSLLQPYESYEVSKLMELASIYSNSKLQSDLLFSLNKESSKPEEIMEQSLLIFELYKSILDQDYFDIVSSSFTSKILGEASNKFNYAAMQIGVEEGHDFHMELLSYGLGDDSTVKSMQEKNRDQLTQFFGKDAVEEVLKKTKKGSS